MSRTKFTRPDWANSHECTVPGIGAFTGRIRISTLVSHALQKGGEQRSHPALHTADLKDRDAQRDVGEPPPFVDVREALLS